MTMESSSYSSVDISNQVDRLKVIGTKTEGMAYHPIIAVGPWDPRALAISREMHLDQALLDYQLRLSKSKTGLWLPEEVINRSELQQSRTILSKAEKIALEVIAGTEGLIDFFEAAGRKVFTTPAIMIGHQGWSDEERRHSISTNEAHKIINGPDENEIKEGAAQIQEETPTWNHKDYEGLDNEVGHAIYTGVQELRTADADEKADQLLTIAHNKAGIYRIFGLSRIYRAIRPEEMRHAGAAINKSKIEFCIDPIRTIGEFRRVKKKFKMPGQDSVPNSLELPVILYAPERTEDMTEKAWRWRGVLEYMKGNGRAFDTVAKSVFGLKNPKDIDLVEKKIEELNRSLTRPTLMLVRNIGELEEYQAA